MTVDELIGQVGDASCRFVGYMRRLFEVFEAELDANDIRTFRRRPERCAPARKERREVVERIRKKFERLDQRVGEGRKSGPLPSGPSSPDAAVYL
jgi:hypothetical protein